MSGFLTVKRLLPFNTIALAAGISESACLRAQCACGAAKAVRFAHAWQGLPTPLLVHDGFRHNLRRRGFNDREHQGTAIALRPPEIRSARRRSQHHVFISISGFSISCVKNLNPLVFAPMCIKRPRRSGAIQRVCKTLSVNSRTDRLSPQSWCTQVQEVVSAACAPDRRSY